MFTDLKNKFLWDFLPLFSYLWVLVAVRPDSDVYITISCQNCSFTLSTSPHNDSAQPYKSFYKRFQAQTCWVLGRYIDHQGWLRHFIQIIHIDDSFVLLIFIFSKVTIGCICNLHNIFETSYLLFFSIFKQLIKMMQNVEITFKRLILVGKDFKCGIKVNKKFHKSWWCSGRERWRDL